MKRRAFITLLGGAATWPLVARAQQPAKLTKIGFLGSSTPSVASPNVSAFVQRLGELDWAEGRNLSIEYRWMEGDPTRAPESVAELINLKVDLIVTGGGTPSAMAAKQAAVSIPIVFVGVSDPVGSKLV